MLREAWKHFAPPSCVPRDETRSVTARQLDEGIADTLVSLQAGLLGSACRQLSCQVRGCGGKVGVISRTSIGIGGEHQSSFVSQAWTPSPGSSRPELQHFAIEIAEGPSWRPVRGPPHYPIAIVAQRLSPVAAQARGALQSGMSKVLRKP